MWAGLAPLLHTCVYSVRGLSKSRTSPVPGPVTRPFDIMVHFISVTPVFQDEDLKAEIIADLKEAFSCSDRNGDGHICAKELTKVMRSMGMNPTESEIVEIMAKLDIDVNGVIELHEFIPLMLQRVQSMDTEEEIKKVFKVFDRDGNGFINETELRFMMNHVLKQEISDDDVDDLLKEADVDGDGRLNYDEFVRMLVNDLA